jgi:hypothetical protein
MLSRSLAYFAMQQDPGALPLAVAVLQTDRGVRVWSDRMLTDAETWTPSGGTLADGSALANGSLQAGAQIAPIIERSARLTDPGTPSEQTLPPDQFGQATTALSGRQVGDLTITLDNSDRGPSQALGIETWLSGQLSEGYGFRGLARQDWLERFRGIVQRIELTTTSARLTARAS